MSRPAVRALLALIVHHCGLCCKIWGCWSKRVWTTVLKWAEGRLCLFITVSFPKSTDISDYGGIFMNLAKCSLLTATSVLGG